MKKAGLILLISLLLLPFGQLSTSSSNSGVELIPSAQAEEDGGWSMSGFTLAPKVGYGFFPKHQKAMDGDLGQRHAVIAGLSLDLGGDGFNFEIMPLYTYEEVDDVFIETIHMVGANVNFAYRWTPSQYAVPSLGFGLRAGYDFGSGFKDGFEIYGRIPIGFTTYVINHFGIHFELGIGYGITGIITKDITLTDLVANEVCKEVNTQTQGLADCQEQDSGLRISHGFLIDLSVGFRFP